MDGNFFNLAGIIPFKMDPAKQNSAQTELKVKGQKTPSCSGESNNFLRYIGFIYKIKRGLGSNRSPWGWSEGCDCKYDPLEKEKFNRMERNIKTCKKSRYYRITAGPLNRCQQYHYYEKYFPPFSNNFVVGNKILPEFSDFTG